MPLCTPCDRKPVRELLPGSPLRSFIAFRIKSKLEPQRDHFPSEPSAKSGHFPETRIPPSGMEMRRFLPFAARILEVSTSRCLGARHGIVFYTEGTLRDRGDALFSCGSS